MTHVSWGHPLLAASLVVKPRVRSNEGSEILRRVTSELNEYDLKDVEAVTELEEQLTEQPPESDDFAHWCVIPEFLLAGNKAGCQFLPQHLQAFPSKLGSSPKEAERKAKEVLASIYQAAQNPLGGNTYVPMPSDTTLQEAELSNKLVWRQMAIVEPPQEKDIPFEVTAAAPQWISFDKLSDAQQMLYTEMQAIVDMAEYILYWSRAGWLPEAETEIED